VNLYTKDFIKKSIARNSRHPTAVMSLRGRTAPTGGGLAAAPVAATGRTPAASGSPDGGRHPLPFVVPLCLPRESLTPSPQRDAPDGGSAAVFPQELPERPDGQPGAIPREGAGHSRWELDVS